MASGAPLAGPLFQRLFHPELTKYQRPFAFKLSARDPYGLFAGVNYCCPDPALVRSLFRNRFAPPCCRGGTGLNSTVHAPYHSLYRGSPTVAQGFRLTGSLPVLERTQTALSLVCKHTVTV